MGGDCIMGVSAGRVLLIPKGDWNAETTYIGLDWVRHNGAAWVCKNTCTNVEPTEENSDNWQIIARDGQSGSVINVDATMSDTSENPVQNKVVKKYVDDKQVNIDGITLTLDEARNVIKLADVLKDKIGTALQPESIVNNQVTTETGYALDARQANPNLDGTLANQISKLNADCYFEDEILPTNYAYESNFTWKFYRIGNIIVISANSIKNVPTNAQFTLFDSIPEKYRPKVNMYFRVYDVNTNKIIELNFKTNGSVLVWNYTGNPSTSHNIGGSVMYIGENI